jgi:hypothetical protein
MNENKKRNPIVPWHKRFDNYSFFESKSFFKKPNHSDTVNSS